MTFLSCVLSFKATGEWRLISVNGTAHALFAECVIEFKYELNGVHRTMLRIAVFIRIEVKVVFIAQWIMYVERHVYSVVKPFGYRKIDVIFAFGVS